MRVPVYVNESTSPVSVRLYSNNGIILTGIWKKRKNMWCIFEPGSKKNIIDVP